MSIHVGLRILLGLVALLIFWPLAAASPAMPVWAIVQDQKSYISPEAVIGGVVGYTDNCEFALYSNRRSAADRNVEHSLSIGIPGKDAVNIGEGISLNQVVGKHVLAKGDVEYQVTDKAKYKRAVENVSIYYSFGNVGSALPCSNRNIGKKIRSADVGELIRDWPEDLGLTVRVRGVLGRIENQLVLFTDTDSAAESVWIDGVLLLLPQGLDGKTTASYLSRPISYVEVHGIAAHAKARGYDIVLKDAEIISLESE